MKPLLPKVRVTKDNSRKVAANLRTQIQGLPRKEALVRRIVGDVRKRGDRALVDYTRRFDGANLRQDQLRIPRSDIVNATERVGEPLLSALRFSLKRLEVLQGELLSKATFSSELNGFQMRLTLKPLPSVGCYVPGGRAIYPSTLLMTAGLAKLAGVPRVVVCTPPDSTGTVNDAVLAAANLCNVDEVYRCGGVHAIAALAYGTNTIHRVEKVVGPGGIFVALAKKVVSGDVAIDSFAGPTELIVIADETSDPRLVAWDLVAQAEHGADCLSGLVTCSEDVVKNVRSEIEQILPQIERRKYVESSFVRGFSALCDNWDEACEFVNQVAPEHLELLTENARTLSEKIKNAGLILVGPFAPASATDYCIGSNHVLPTGGFAKSHAGLSSLDFVRPTWTIEGSSEGLESVLQPLKVLTTAEDLPNHFRSVESRFTK
jgi:histidinol dehydrogenase